MQKHMANAIPTCARALERLAGVVTSDRMALIAKNESQRQSMLVGYSHGQLHVSLT